MAHDTGEVRTYRNPGNLKFQMMDNPTTGSHAFPMGIAVRNIGTKDLPDLFFYECRNNYPGIGWGEEI